MKKNTCLSIMTLAAWLVGGVGGVGAGTLTISHGPSFRPDSAFTENSIDAVLLENPGDLVGDVVRLYGDSNVDPTVASPRILVGGSFVAAPGDVYSVAYSFSVNLNSPDPITLRLDAQAVVAGVHQSFGTMLTINPGLGHYEGQINGIVFDLATSGIWKGRLIFNFAAPVQAAGGAGGDDPNPGGLTLQLDYIDYQLTAVPEPSSCILLGLGSVALVLFARRRRRA